MKIVRVKSVRKTHTLHVVPHTSTVQEKTSAEGQPVDETPNLLREVQSLCEKSNSIADQMGRIMNMDENEFDRDKAIGLYRRVATLRATGLVLFGQMEGAGINDGAAPGVVALTCKQARRMMKDMEYRLRNG